MWVIESYVVDKNGRVHNPCGSNYCAIFHDLKTLRGVLNRIRDWKFPKDVIEVRV